MTVSGITTFTCNGSPQGPNTYTTVPVGDTGSATWSYVGTGSTTYGPSATPPTLAGTYTAQVLLGSDSNNNAASSSPTAFTINPAAASKLVFTTQPGTTVAGSSISPAVVVTVEDTYGNTVTGFNGGVTIGSGTTSFTGGTLSVNAVAGVATFSAINPTTAGSANTLYANGDSLPQVNFRHIHGQLDDGGR